MIKADCYRTGSELLDDLTPEKSLAYLRKLGVTSMNSEKDNNLSLALGGITNGISPLQMAAAYATIANDGEYIAPTFYTKVVDSNGKIIIEANQEKERVFSEQNAYILKQLLIEPTKSGGTATVCTISGMNVAAKTGTSNFPDSVMKTYKYRHELKFKISNSAKIWLFSKIFSL